MDIQIIDHTDYLTNEWQPVVTADGRQFPSQIVYDGLNFFFLYLTLALVGNCVYASIGGLWYCYAHTFQQLAYRKTMLRISLSVPLIQNGIHKNSNGATSVQHRRFLISPYYVPKCTMMRKKKILWPVFLLQNLQGRVLCVWKEWVNNPDCPFPPLHLVTLEPFNQKLAFCYFERSHSFRKLGYVHLPAKWHPSQITTIINAVETSHLAGHWTTSTSWRTCLSSRVHINNQTLRIITWDILSELPSLRITWSQSKNCQKICKSIGAK